MKIVSYRRFALWWQLAMDWFRLQFAAIAASLDFTPVEEKLDDVKDDVADVKAAVDNLPLIPTVEIDGSNVLFHYVTLDQMAMMHIMVELGGIGFTLIKGTLRVELRISDDSPQEVADQLVYADYISNAGLLFDEIVVELPESYEVTAVSMDGISGNLLEADINWRLADVQRGQTTTAKETTAQEIKELVLQEGIILGNEYAETINNIIGDWNNE